MGRATHIDPDQRTAAQMAYCYAFAAGTGR